MPRAPDSTTDTYLDVLRTLGVTDAALRRHHDAAPETPLRVAIDGDRGAPTADLLSALAATGRVLDLRDGLAAGDGNRLTAALCRFGYSLACSPATDADDSDALELRVRDAVTGDAESLRTAPDAAAVEATLREALLEPLDVELVELLDGRHLVAEGRELESLAASYGERIEPYDDPLLVPDAAIEVDDGPSASAARSATDEATSVGELWGADASDERTTTADPSASSGTPRDGAPAADDADSFGEALADADDETTDSIEAALSEGGPSTHTIEADEDLAAASETTVGGGPRRTVSTTGIDEVFDQLESSTAEAASTQDAQDSAPSRPTETTMENASDPPTDASASSDDTGETSQGLSGGPKRTVSTTSADDILARATGERDFETIAAEEGDADPDAVLAEGEVPSALEDSGVTPASAEADDADPDVDESAPSPTSRTDSGPEEVDVAEVAGAAEEAPGAAEETQGAAEESAGAADRPPADPAPPASSAASAESSPDATDEPQADEMAAAAGASGSTDAAAVADDEADSTPADEPDPTSADEADAAATDDDPASPAPATGNDDHDDPAPSEDATATPEPGDLGDDLLDDDVELRGGSASVDEPAAPTDGPVETNDDEPAAADGPLAARGGLRPDEGDSEPEAVDEPTADDSGPGDESTAEGPRSADAAGAGSTSDDSTTDTPERTEQSTGPGSPAPDETPDADAGAEDDSTEDGGDAGLVGRITSTIFGR